MKEALKLALEVLEKVRYRSLADKFVDPAIAAIKETLAQSEQEPVAKVVSTAPDRIWLDLGFDPQDEYEIIFHELHDVTWSQDNASGNGIEYVRADTAPPKREWVGLTDEEIESCANWRWMTTCRAIEAKLKEKNT